MSKFLFSLWEGGGETPPIASLIGATVRAGHEVVVLADPVLRPDVERAGAEWRPWTDAPATSESTRLIAKPTRGPRNGPHDHRLTSALDSSASLSA